MFVSFEGIDGCGKTTHLRLFKERLEKEGHKVEVVKEVDIVTRCKSCADVCRFFKLCCDEALFFGFLSQMMDTEEGVARLERNRIVVLADRNVHSTVAYTVLLSCAGSPMVKSCLSSFYQYCRKPDQTFFLDTPLQICLRRLESKSTQHPFEKIGLDRVQTEFYRLSRNDPRVVVVKSVEYGVILPAEKVSESIWESFTKLRRSYGSTWL